MTRRVRSEIGWKGFVVGLLLYSSTVEAQAPAPVYQVESCCSLCPLAADPAYYVTRFMTSNRLVIEGTGDWLFRTETDLDTDLAVSEAVYADLARMVTALNARGTQVLVLDIPPRGLFTADKLLPADRERYDRTSALANYRQTLQRFREIGFIVPDYGSLADLPDADDYFFRQDTHWTPEGARRTAELIADTVQALPLHAGLLRKEFTTTAVGLRRHPGVLAIVASQICGGNYPAEMISGYATSPKEANPFADEPIPQVAVVGSSFSASPAYHFLGFLQQALQADVLNTSVAGGNFDGAMTQYLLSELFQESPPKLLIWEFGHRQIAVANHTQMRRLVPLVSNGCADQRALLANDVALSFGQDLTAVLFNGGGHILTARSRDLVVDLQFEDPAVSEILGEAWYLDGKHEQVRVRMNDFTRANGRFVIELNREPDFAQQPLIMFRVQIVTPLSEPTTVSAKLCRQTEGLS
jgi:alginate biosynthesis protein AlgX